MDARLMVKIEPNIDEPQMRSRSNTWPLRPKPVLAAPSDEAQHANVTIDETPELDFDLEATQQPAAVDSPGLDTDNSYCNDLQPDHSVKKAPTRKNAWGNLSYADLITKAIQSAHEKRLTLSQIYEWMVQNVPYFRDKGDSNSSAGWKNSIRHNLSLHNRFMRIQNEGAGKSSWWVMNPDAKPGKTPRRRATSMDTKAYEKKRGRAKKKVEAMRAGSNGNGGSLADGCSGSQDPISSGLMEDNGGDFELSPGGFRSRASSNASSIVMSPMTLRDTDMHTSQVPQMSPWGSESNLSDYLASDPYQAAHGGGGGGGEQDSLAANLVDIMKLTASEMSGSYMDELTEGLGCSTYGSAQALLIAPSQQQPQLTSQGSSGHLQQLQPLTPQTFCGPSQTTQQQAVSYDQQSSLFFLGGTSPVLASSSIQQQQRHYRSPSGGSLLNDLLASDMAEPQASVQQPQYSSSSANGLLSSLLAADSPISPSSPQQLQLQQQHQQLQQQHQLQQQQHQLQQPQQQLQQQHQLQQQLQQHQQQHQLQQPQQHQQQQHPLQQQQYVSAGRSSLGLLGGLLTTGTQSPPPSQQPPPPPMYSAAVAAGSGSRLLSDLLADTGSASPQSQSPIIFDSSGHLDQQQSIPQQQQRYLGQQGASGPSPPPPPFGQRNGSGGNLSCTPDSAGFSQLRTSQMQQRPHQVPSSSSSSSASSLLRAALQQHQQFSSLRQPSSGGSGEHLAVSAATSVHSNASGTRQKGLQTRGGGGDGTFGNGPSGVCASLSQLAYARNHTPVLASTGSLAARLDPSGLAGSSSYSSSGSGILADMQQQQLLQQRQQGLPSDLDFNFDSLRAEAIECDVDMVIRQELSIDGSLDFTGIDTYQPCGEAAGCGGGNGAPNGGSLVLS